MSGWRVYGGHRDQISMEDVGRRGIGLVGGCMGDVGL